MHELSITQCVVDVVCEHARGRPVSSVRIEVGRLSGMVVESLEFCFEIVAAGTLVEGARLEFDQPEGRAHCRECSSDFTVEDLVLLCPCGSACVDITAGRDLRVMSMEVG